MCARDKLRHSIDDHLGNNIYDNVYVHGYNNIQFHDDVYIHVFDVYGSGTGAHDDVDVDGFSYDHQFHVGDHHDHLGNHDDQFHFGNYDDGV